MIVPLSLVGRASRPARVLQDPLAVDPLITGWSVDTRTLEPGDLFFALRGPNHDGHAYVTLAFEKGAVAAVVDHPMPDANTLVVPDSLTAIQNLAAWARQHWGGRIVGVTGSAGKTTVKDAIAHLLAVELPVGKTCLLYTSRCV